MGGRAAGELARRGVDALVMVALALSGPLLHPAPWLGLRSFAELFVLVSALHWGTALPLQLLASKCGTLIQSGPEAQRELVGLAVIDTLRGFSWTVASLLAWPVANARMGLETGLRAELADCVPLLWPEQPWAVSLVLYLAKALLGLVLADAYSYWKHRVFHSRTLWPFHRSHHAHHNPSAISGFAVSPLFGLATFWPLATFVSPAVGLWAPVHGPIVAFYLLLNHYLHCGFVVEPLERVLEPFMIMSSRFHNVHHEKGRVGFNFKEQTFGEMLTLWDYVCGTHPAGRFTYSGAHGKAG